MNTLYQNAHSPERVTVNALQYLDVVFVVIAAILALVLGAPALGVTVGAVALDPAARDPDRRSPPDGGRRGFAAPRRDPLR